MLTMYPAKNAEGRVAEINRRQAERPGLASRRGKTRVCAVPSTSTVNRDTTEMICGARA
jgi:hypothetical protein